MTLKEIKEQIMFQTNNDADDLEDFEPHIVDYINDGYDRIVVAFDHQHVDPASEMYPTMEQDTDDPNLPEWMHQYLSDWATWLVYRNGNPQKQQRGYAFRQRFEELLARIAGEGGKNGMNDDGTLKRYRNFINIPE
jgi:hypothetical protein